MRKYNADSIIMGVTSESWKYWQSDKSIEAYLQEGDQFGYLLRAYGHKVASLAKKFCNPNSTKPIDTQGIKWFVYNYLEINDGFYQGSSEPAETIAAIKAHQDFDLYPRLGDCIDGDFADTFGTAVFMARQLNSQHHMCTQAGVTFERSFLIFKEFLKKISDSEYTKIRTYLGMEPINFVRATYALLVHFSGGLNTGDPGFLSLNRNGFEEVLKLDELDIQPDDIFLVLQRLTWTREGIIEWLNNNLRWDELNAKHFVAPLGIKPFLEIETDHMEMNFALPSPWFVLVKLSSSFNDYFNDIFSTDEIAEKRSKWGQATEEVLKRIVEVNARCDTFIDVDETNPNRDEPFSDLILVGGSDVLIIELKTTMAGINDKFKMGPKQLPTMLFRQLSAIFQCHSTERNLSSYYSGTIENVAYAVVTSQYQVYDSAVVTHLDSYSDFFSERGINGFEVMDIDEFENLLIDKDVSGIVREIINRTSLRRSFEFDKIERFAKKNLANNTDFYLSAAEELMPGADERRRARL